MKALPHQITKSKSIIRKLRLYGVCLFAGEIRSGKTAAFILAADKLSDGNYIVVTKKNAIDGVKKFTPNVTNYHQAGKYNPTYKVVVLDECHRYITAYPKRSKIWKDITKLCSGADYVIFSSGTPTPESMAMLFNMLAVSLDSPWSHFEHKKDRKLPYTRWHLVYGVPTMKVIGWDEYRNKPKKAIDYSVVNEGKIENDIKHLKVSMTREEAGHKYEPSDKLHHISLTEDQQDIYETLEKDRIYNVDDEYDIVADTASKYLQKLHQTSGGFVNAVDLMEQSKIFEVDSDKVKYIKDNFNPEDTIILAYYIPEQEHLSNVFPNVGSITKMSDGVDYSHFKHMVIYSLGFSAATYEQVRGRQLNFMTRKEEVIIHFLISGIDQYVYDAVSAKKNFTARWYKDNKK